jgi:NADH dehydrogenase [ubiquinone] 1 alpha subcomplex assembly factor 7
MAEALAARIADEIKTHGPIGLDRYWHLALLDPDHGYYQQQAAIGDGGDFTTAPEISQIFGELIGLWLVDQWRTAGAPEKAAYAEPGPGRGQLLDDIFRVATAQPGFPTDISVALLEPATAMRALQAKVLAKRGIVRVRYVDHPAYLLSGGLNRPVLMAANEYLDVLAIRQFQFSDGAWRERLISLDEHGGFTFVSGANPLEPPGMDPTLLGSAPPEGSIYEFSIQRDEAVGLAAINVRERGGAALFIDYGHASSRFGDSLQALQNGEPADPLADPGGADITSHVDFARIARVAESLGAKAWGPVDQGTFLLRLGAEARAEQLCRNAPPEEAVRISQSLRRLIHPLAMGSLFKVMAITQKDVAPPPGFD